MAGVPGLLSEPGVDGFPTPVPVPVPLLLPGLPVLLPFRPYRYEGTNQTTLPGAVAEPGSLVL
jgi:hypothetical protein